MEKLNTGFAFIAFILIINTVGYIATDIYLPALPTIGLDFGVNDAQMQYTLAAFLISFGCMPLFFGPYSDVIGRKKVILLGLGVTLIATIICGIATRLNVLIMARFLQGIGCAAIMAGGRAIIPDSFKAEKMAQIGSIVTMIIPLFLAIAPLIGGYILEFSSWHTIFVTLSVYVSALIALVYFGFRNSNIPTNKRFSFKESIKTYINFRTRTKFLLYGSLPALIFAAISAYIAVSPFIYQSHFGLSPSQFGILSLTGSIVAFSLGGVNALIVKRVGSLRLLFVATLCIALSGISLLIAHLMGSDSILVVFLSCSLLFASIPFGMPNAFTLSFSNLRQDYGSASAIISSFQIACAAIITALFSLWPTNTVLPLATCFITIGLLMAIVLHKAIKAPT